MDPTYRLFVLRGIPGSGKSRLAEARVRHSPRVSVCSADHFFLQQGVYIFDPAKIAQAHHRCFIRAMELVRAHVTPEILIDNTNLTAAECAPYVLLGESHGYAVTVVTLDCPPKLAVERNVHGVPQVEIGRMLERLHRERLPPWWTHRVVSQDQLDAPDFAESLLGAAW